LDTSPGQAWTNVAGPAYQISIDSPFDISDSVVQNQGVSNELALEDFDNARNPEPSWTQNVGDTSDPWTFDGKQAHSKLDSWRCLT
jgi:hypothetical protein